MIESVAGFIRAAPTPCTVRAAISELAPPARPHHSEAPVKITSPATKIFRRPIMSASFPPVSSNTPKVSAYAFTTHSSSEMLMPRSLRIEGSATLTTVLSSMIMKSPIATATSVHHLRFSGAKRRARISERLEDPPIPMHPVTRTLRACPTSSGARAPNRWSAPT